MTRRRRAELAARLANGELVRLDELEVRVVCRRCYRDRPDVSTIRVELVSPGGRAHRPGDDGYSACGLDATRDGWWWAL